MKEEKIREKYPNIQTEEEFEKLCKMLKYKNNEKIAICCACVLLILGTILYRLNLIIAIICMVVSFVVWIIGVARWGRHIDEFFLATASRKRVEKRTVLTKKIFEKSLKKSIIKESFSDFMFSEIFGALCMIVCSLVLTLDTDSLIIFFVLIPLAAFAILRICAIAKRRKIQNTTSILLHTKLIGRDSRTSLDENSSELYYFIFDCDNYGVLDYEVSKEGYHSAFVDEDSYYLVVVKKRFSKKYKIVEIFSTEEYELSPELEKTVRAI